MESSFQQSGSHTQKKNPKGYEHPLVIFKKMKSQFKKEKKKHFL